MDKFIIAFFSSLAGYLTVIVIFMLGTIIYKIVKEIYDNKTKLRIFFNHNFVVHFLTRYSIYGIISQGKLNYWS